MSIQNPASRTRVVQQPKGTESLSVTNHAELRWLQRSETVELTPREAWQEGYYVGCEDRGGTTRLHPPTETILLKRDDTLITVLNSANISYNANHLVICKHCGLEYQPDGEYQNCPWCTADYSKVEQ
jgi:hypothetical protein